MVAALVRQLASLSERQGGAASTSIDGLLALLERASRLPGKEYGEVSVAAAQALLSLRTPPFDTRKAELRATLLKSTDNDALARSATITAGVDLLTSLFTDEDAKVPCVCVYWVWDMGYGVMEGLMGRLVGWWLLRLDSAIDPGGRHTPISPL